MNFDEILSGLPPRMQEFLTQLFGSFGQQGGGRPDGSDRPFGHLRHKPGQGGGRQMPTSDEVTGVQPMGSPREVRQANRKRRAERRQQRLGLGAASGGTGGIGSLGSSLPSGGGTSSAGTTTSNTGWGGGGGNWWSRFFQ